jgi:PAS domain S-box-containing protein
MRSTSERDLKEAVKGAIRSMQALPTWVRRLGYYILALLFVAAAAMLRWALPEVLGPTPYLAFYLAWVGAAVFGGLGPGLLATVASWVCIDLFDSTGQVTSFHDPTAIGRLVVLLAGGLAVSLVAATMRRGRRRERESEAQLRTVVENLTEGLIVADLSGRLFRWNRTALKMHGFGSLDEARRRLPEFADIFELSTLDGTVVPLEQWPLARVLRGEDLRDWEVRVRRITGNWERTFSYAGSLVRDEPGQPLLAILTITDITERKRAEEELRESESFYRQTLESIPGMVFTTRPDGYCDYQSQQWVDYTGVPMSEHLGEGWNKLLHPEDRPRAFAAWRAAVEGKAPYDLEYRVRRRDGQYEWFKVIGRPIRDAAGQIVRWFGVAINIEAIKHAEEALREANKRLREQTDELTSVNKDLEQFAYIASHDLQEPLRAVSGFVTLLQQRYSGKLDEKADSYINSAVEGASRMQALINGLLEYSRVGSRGNVPAPANTDDALKEALASLQTLIQESGAIVTSDPLPRVRADVIQLTHVFQNLIANAIRFRSERLPEIQVGARRQEGAWLFWVRDNGIGIDPKYNERIFIIFQRLHTRSKYPGTGIGLAICKRIVERHGGTIWVESQPGQGSTFYFTLPDKGETHESS